MLLYVYPVISTKNNRCDYVYIKRDDSVFLLKSKSWIENNLDKTEDEIVFYGGHSVLNSLINFGFDECCKYIDIQHYFWNRNTSKVNLSLAECYIEYCCSKLQNIVSVEDVCSIVNNIGIKTYSYDCDFKKIDINDVLFNWLNDLFLIMEKLFVESSFVFSCIADDIDNELCKSLNRLELSKTKLDLSYLTMLKNKINTELSNILNSIYFLTGKQFNINSQREFNYILKEFGILNNRISKIDLANNYDQTGILLFKYIDRFRRLKVCYEQYLKPLYESALNSGYGRFKYNMCNVPCLTQGHFCVEKQKGIIDISDIELGDYIWTEYGFKKVIRKNKYPCNDLLKIKLSNGLSVTGTRHHPVLINNSNDDNNNYHNIEREWCSLEHLFVGDKIICSNNFGCVFYDECLVQHRDKISLIICSIFNDKIDGFQKELNYVKLSGIRFSHYLSFFEFKSYCEFLGLKNISYCLSNDYSVYDICFYDKVGLNRFYKKYKSHLTNRVCKIFDKFLGNIEYNYIKTKDGVFVYEYEETIVTEIVELKKSELVYDIEVEDVHEYNANGVINHNTGRLSSVRGGNLYGNEYVNVNIQSIPKSLIDDVNIRKAFISDNNCYWCNIDYKAQEMRLVSNLYKVQDLISIPLSSDIYLEIGKKFKIFDGLEIPIETKRSAIKIICLGIIYGLTNFGIGKQLKQLGIDNDNIDLRSEFFKLYPQIEYGQLRTLKYAHSVNGIYTLSGRFRKIEFTTYDKENLFTRNNRIALNTVIQGSCGDIIRNVINNIENNIEPCYNKYGFRLLNTIHDEINFYLPKQKKLFKEILENVVKVIQTPFTQKPDLNFGYSISLGESWGTLKKYDLFQLEDSL